MPDADGGKVLTVDYRKGGFMNAMKPESVMFNEQTLVVVRDGKMDVSFKLIAGLLARRIVCNVHEGDVLERGQRIGMIKFGSRVDVLLPGDAQLQVVKGKRVKGGSTVLAKLVKSNNRSTANDGRGRRRMTMQDDEMQQRPGRRRRGMYILPSLFTSLNIAFGFYAITQSLQGSLVDPTQVRPGGAGDRAGGAVRRAGRAHRAHDEHGERVRPGAGFAGRRDHVRRGAEHIGVVVGVPDAAPDAGQRGVPEADGAGRVCELHVPDLRGVQAGAVQHQRGPGTEQSGTAGPEVLCGDADTGGGGVRSAVVHFFDGSPIYQWWWALVWVVFVGSVGLLMVSRWRFWSGKEINLGRRHPFQAFVLVALVGWLIFLNTQWALMIIALGYMSSGLLARLGYSWQRAIAKRMA